MSIRCGRHDRRGLGWRRWLAGHCRGGRAGSAAHCRSSPSSFVCSSALKQALANEAVRERIRSAESTLLDELTPAQQERWRKISDVKNDADNEELFRFVTEVMRHVPALGTAMSKTAAHVFEMSLDELGTCCTLEWDWGSVEI